MEALYERAGAKSFLDNFGVSIHFTPGPKDIASAELISKLLGYKTVKSSTHSRRGSMPVVDDKGNSESVSDQRRALMLPQEVMRLPNSKEIVLIAGGFPIIADKLFAQNDPRFATRFKPAPEVPQLIITHETLPHVQNAPSPAAQSETIKIDASNIDSLDDFDLSNFSLDFSAVRIPKEPITDSDAEQMVKDILGVVFEQVPAIERAA